jgi:hypothetical protein
MSEERQCKNCNDPKKLTDFPTWKNGKVKGRLCRDCINDKQNLKRGHKTNRNIWSHLDKMGEDEKWKWVSTPLNTPYY